MPERDANQLAAAIKDHSATLADWAEDAGVNSTAIDDERAELVAALDELVGLVGTLQQEHDEARLDALMAHKAAEIHSDKAVAAEAALAEAHDREAGTSDALDDTRRALATTRQALADALDYTECKGHCADGGCPFCGGVLNIARRALVDTGGDTP